MVVVVAVGPVLPPNREAEKSAGAGAGADAVVTGVDGAPNKVDGAGAAGAVAAELLPKRPPLQGAAPKRDTGAFSVALCKVLDNAEGVDAVELNPLKTPAADVLGVVVVVVVTGTGAPYAGAAVDAPPKPTPPAAGATGAAGLAPNPNPLADGVVIAGVPAVVAAPKRKSPPLGAGAGAAGVPNGLGVASPPPVVVDGAGVTANGLLGIPVVALVVAGAPNPEGAGAPKAEGAGVPKLAPLLLVPPKRPPPVEVAGVVPLPLPLPKEGGVAKPPKPPPGVVVAPPGVPKADEAGGAAACPKPKLEGGFLPGPPAPAPPKENDIICYLRLVYAGQPPVSVVVESCSFERTPL